MLRGSFLIPITAAVLVLAGEVQAQDRVHGTGMMSMMQERPMKYRLR